MLARLVAITALLASTAASAQQLPPNYLGRVGGVTTEVCAVPVITPSSAYTAGNSVGGLITLPAAFLSTNSGILQAVRLTSKSAQTVEFDIVFFSALPSTTFTDKTAPAIGAADVLLTQPPITLTNNYSGLGADTIYGADAIGRPVNEIGTSAYALITTPGTPTFASASDLQLCASWLQD
jgi:hypothetical protein